MDILYSDKQIVVCIKPLGLDSEQELPQALKEMFPGEIFPIHRLDKNVSGVMVYARTKAAAAELSRAVQEGTMIKEYVARVHGVPPQQGDWTDLLFKDSRKNKVFVVKRKRAGVKEARLEYQRLSQEDPCLVRIRLPGEAIRFGFSSPAGAFRWLGTISTARGMKKPPQSSIPAVWYFPMAGRSAGLNPFRIGRNCI